MESAGTPARARASRMATAPRSTAWSALNPPANFPMGVRAPATMTERSLVALMAAAPAARVSVPVYGRPCVRRAGPRVDARMNRRRCWPRVKPGVSMSPSDGQGGCHGAHRDAPVLDRLLHLAAPVDRVDGRAHPQSVVGTQQGRRHLRGPGPGLPADDDWGSNVRELRRASLARSTPRRVHGLNPEGNLTQPARST